MLYMLLVCILYLKYKIQAMTMCAL